jgi:L-arabinokinase
MFPRVQDLPLVARHATRGRDETRAYFGIPADRRAALLSFGGYGLPGIDITRADCFDEWTVVTTDRVSTHAPVPGHHIVAVAETAFRGSGFRYEDLVAAVDVVVTKPGYGIIAECIANERPMLYTSRGAFREYDLLVAEMPRYLRSSFITGEDLHAGRWRLALHTAVTAPPAPERIRTNGAEVAAGGIREIASL